MYARVHMDTTVPCNHCTFACLLPRAVIAIDEYEKLPCELRVFFKNMMKGILPGLDMNEAVVLFASNANYTNLVQAMNAKGRDELPEDTITILKKDVYAPFKAMACRGETPADIANWVGLQNGLWRGHSLRSGGHTGVAGWLEEPVV